MSDTNTLQADTDILQKMLTETIPFKLKDNTRTLVIGLGGTGVNWASITKRVLVERYSKDQISEKMDFYCIDTKATGRPSNIVEEEWQWLENLDKDSKWINGWLHPDINKLDVRSKKEGSAKPMAGRWKLFSSEQVVMKHLKEIIHKYSTRIGRGIEKIYVVILAGICGGTGCGTFIDIPYFVRLAIKSQANVFKENFEFYGILELPDSKRGYGLDSIAVKEGNCNAYAALMELYHFMDRETRKKNPVWVPFYGESEDFLYEDVIFDKCFLVSNYRAGGEDRNEYETVLGKQQIKTAYLDVAVPEVINAMISEPRPEEEYDSEGNIIKEQHHDFTSAMDDIGSKFREDTESGNLKYGATIGVAKYEIPLKKILEAVFTRLFVLMYDKWQSYGEDQVTIEMLVNEKMVPIFNLLGTAFDNFVETIEKVANSYGDEDVLDKNFIDGFKRKISSLWNQTVDSTKNSISEALNNAIDELYKDYGPSFVFQVFKENRLINCVEKEINDIYQKVANKLYNGNIHADIAEVNNTVDLFGKRKKLKNALIENIRKYVIDEGREYVYDKITKMMVDGYEHNGRHINGIITETRNKLFRIFENITTMIKLLNDTCFKNLGIKASKKDVMQIYKSSVTENTMKLTAGWNASRVSHRDIDEKTGYMFWKRITIKGNTKNYLYTQDKIYKRDETERELFFYDANKHNGKEISIKYGSDTVEGVTSIEDIIRFVPGVDKDIIITDMVEKFLIDIKKVSVDNNATFEEWLRNEKTQEEHRKEIEKEILSVIYKNMKEITDIFKSAAFEEYVIHSSEKVSLHETLTTERKEELFRKQIDDFYLKAEPSFPIISGRRQDTINERNFSEFFIPKEINENYKKIIGKSSQKLLSKEQIKHIPLPKSSMMIAVNFYFGFDFASYLFLADCKRDYDNAMKNEKSIEAIGLHIAEGTEYNIRPLLKPIEPLGNS